MPKRVEHAGYLEIAILHLVRAGNDYAALERFVDSYVKHPAGYRHRLIFLLKGFPYQLPGDLSDILDRVAHTRMTCPDGGYDIGSYYYAIGQIQEPVVMFLNSHSVLRSDLWLLKLVRAYNEPEIGLVGATGSWESMASTQLAISHRYKSRSAHGWLFRLWAQLIGFALLSLFPAFPNPHIRSNGFMIGREDFLAVRPPRIHSKLQAWLFESGRNSMSRQIIRRGLNVAVVGCDGTAYRIENWPFSKTFWQNQQENLLVGDNRTLAYSGADITTQVWLSWAAWHTGSDHR